MSNFRKLYDETIKDSLMKEYNYKSIMEVPKLDKIVINMGVGEGAHDSKFIEAALKDLETLALASITKFMGVAEPTDVPAGTGLGYWEIITPGTYTNFGAVVLAINERGLIARDADGGFTISKTAVDLTPYAKKGGKAVFGNLSRNPQLYH